MHCHEWSLYFQNHGDDIIIRIDDSRITWRGIIWTLLKETDYNNSMVYINENDLILKMTPLTSETLDEIKNHKRLNRIRLVKRHFPISIFHHVSNNNIMCHVQEKRGVDLRTFMMQEQKWDDEEWFALFTQLFFAIYFMNTSAHLSHNDLHWTNVLVMQIDKTEMMYEMGNDGYVLKNQTYLFSICDFASCRESDGDGFEEYAGFVSSIFRWIRRFHLMERPQKVGLFISDIRNDIYEGRHCMKGVFDRYIRKWVTKTSSDCTDVHVENS